MWSDILGMGLFMSLNPMLIAFILLVISRPRPVPNLLAFWVGCMLVNVPAFVIPLVALHMVPSFADFAHDLTAPRPGSAIQPFPLVTGTIALLIVTVMLVRTKVKQRAAKVAASTAGSSSSTIMVLESDGTTTDPRSPGIFKDAREKLRARLKRLSTRLHESWENGSVWVGFVFGVGYLPPPPLVLVIDAMIVGSGESVGTQVAAVIAFVLTMLVVFELALLSYLLSPTRTQAVLEPIHEWSRTHRQLVLQVLFAVVGVWQILVGLGVI